MVGGDKFGQSLVNGNDILGELNARMPQIRRDTKGLADLSGGVYADAAPDLFDGLDHAVVTARTLNAQRGNIDKALMSAVGFGNNAGDIFERGGPYLVRGAQDLLPTSKLLDYYSPPELLCTLRNFHDVAPKFADMLGGNGYSLVLADELVAPETVTSTRTICRGSMRGVDRRVGRVAGSRSPATCGRCRIW